MFAAPALILLVSLGIWQLQRLEQKSALLERIEAGLAAEPAWLPAEIADPASWDYRRVRVEGRFLHDRAIYLTGRTYRGQVGLHVITPLERTDPVAPGQLIFVNRGWIPAEARAAAPPTDAPSAESVSVSGISRKPAPRGWMQPDNEPETGTWFWIELPAIAAVTGVTPAPRVIVEADAGTAELPIGGQTRLDIPNNHLQYAVTWFAFAIILAVIYALYHRRRPEEAADTRSSNHPDRT